MTAETNGASRLKLRYLPKKLGKAWSVYDIERGSHPINTPWTGPVPQDLKTEDAAQEVCDRLNNMEEVK